jgi:stage II sporulation protein D
MNTDFMTSVNFQLWILSLVLVFSFNAQAQLELEQPHFVRVRMFRDLPNFPEVPEADLRKISDVAWSISGDGLKFQNKELTNSNVVVLKTNGHYDLISLVEFHDYLAGVVSQEMPVSWPLEALKAQAVVARSYALARIKERKVRYFHLDSNQADQVFLVTNNIKAKQAVFETDGVLLKTEDNKTLKAYYHADCGGHTVKASDVWGFKSYDSGTAQDPWCALKTKNKWTYEVDREEFETKLALNQDVVSQLRSFIVSQKNQLMVFASQRISVQKIRQVLGFSNVRSSIDSIEFDGQKVKLSGQGYGHGVGLCQWGTLSQIRMGKNYLQVLKHYYPRVQIADKKAVLAKSFQEFNTLKPVSN